jgi:hypothetical protein
MIGKSSSKKKLAILAPVPESFLRTANDRIYPYHKKVSFGSDKIEYMRNIQTEFLISLKDQKDVYVYIYVNGRAKYKAVLIDEFLFYAKKTRHPDPWGWWNEDCKSYYTVKNIDDCTIPLNSFKSRKTSKVILKVERPLMVIDPQ